MQQRSVHNLGLLSRPRSRAWARAYGGRAWSGFGTTVDTTVGVCDDEGLNVGESDGLGVGDDVGPGLWVGMGVGDGVGESDSDDNVGLARSLATWTPT